MSANRRFVVHNDSAIVGIKKASQAAATAKNRIAGMIRAGITTKDIDSMAGAVISSLGGVSAFLGYRGYPGQICISVNDEVVHGIGQVDKMIKEGDIVSIDVGVNLNGYIGDNALTVFVGDDSLQSPEISRLLNGTQESLNYAIEFAIPGNYVRDISVAVEKIAKKRGLSVVQEYVGHGCGVHLHEPPEIPNYKTRDKGPKLRAGMVLAIEPMLNIGKRNVITEKDGWTVRTRDGSLSAHFEHMVLITKSQPEILTWQKI